MFDGWEGFLGKESERKREGLGVGCEEVEGGPAGYKHSENQLRRNAGSAVVENPKNKRILVLRLEKPLGGHSLSIPLDTTASKIVSISCKCHRGVG